MVPVFRNNRGRSLCWRHVITLLRWICRCSISRFCGMLLTLFAVSAAAEEVMFPDPLHLTRRITDPFSEQPVVIEEFCQGNRIVSVIGPVTAIADYSAGTLTRIDRDARTFSVTSFGDWSRSRSAGKLSGPLVSKQPWSVSSAAAGKREGRDVEQVVITRLVDGGEQKLEIASDPRIPISRAAAEALLGFAFPAVPRTVEADLIFGALSKTTNGSSSTGQQMTGLPMNQVERFSFEGEELVSRSEVIRVGSEVIDPRLSEVPAGSLRIELDGLDVWRRLEEMDYPTRQ